MDHAARPLIEDIKADIAALVEERRDGALRAFLVDLHPADIAHLIVVLGDDDDQSFLFGLIADPETASTVLVELPSVVREHILDSMPDAQVADLVGEMSSDDAADVMQELDEERVADVIAGVDPEEREAVRALLIYGEDTAGGIMATEVLSVAQDATVGDARDVVRAHGGDLEPYFYVYVLGKGRRLLGMLSLKDLVLAGSRTPVAQVMNREPLTIPPDLDQEHVADLFRRYDLVAAPVVDDDSTLLGRITVDDVVDVMREEAEEDIARMAGTDEDEFHETSARRIALYRFPWILTSLCGGLVSGFVLDHFSRNLGVGVALVAFAPVIMAMGGNAGSQAAITMVRLISLRQVDRRELLSIVWREARVGVTLGITAGLLMGTVALVWRGAWFYGAVVGLSMALAILFAVSMGSMTPMIFKKFKVDPAIATGPLVTVTNDATGLLIYFGLATLLLHLLDPRP